MYGFGQRLQTEGALPVTLLGRAFELAGMVMLGQLIDVYHTVRFPPR